MKKLLFLLLASISLINCTTKSNQNNLNKSTSIDSTEIKKVDTIKKVDNDMIHFLAIGNFSPEYLKIVADEINIKYLDFDYHNVTEYNTGFPANLKKGEENPFLIKILKNYLDNNNLHPIEGLFLMIRVIFLG